MAVKSGAPVPYAPASAIMAIITKFRGTGMQIPINSEVLMRAGVADSLVPRTLQALQILELITPEGHPTETLKTFRTVPEKDFQQTLAMWVKSVYAEVFQYVDPASNDDVAVRDAFRTYEPQGQIPRMVSLFVGLCTAAGLISGRMSESKPRTRTAVVKAANSSKPRRGVEPVVEALPPPPRTPAALTPPALSGLHPAIAGILTSIPSEKGWTKAERGRFIDTFTAILDFVVPVT